MNLNYKFWLRWLEFHILPLIRLINIKYLPIYTQPKLLAPDLEYFYDISFENELPILKATNKYEMIIPIGINIRYFILDLLNIMFQRLPTTNILNINIKFWFDTEEFTNGSVKIELFKNTKMNLNEIIKLVLEKIHKIDEIYNIKNINSLHIKIIYFK